MHVMDAYLSTHATTIRSEEQAIRAGALVVQYLTDVMKDAAAPLSIWTPSRQKAFAEWLRDSFAHKAGTIERIFNVLSSAFNEAARVKMRADPLGGEIEGALVSHAPAIVMRRSTIAKELKMAPARKGGFVPTMEEMARFLDALETRHLRRWAIMALNTWARPEAIIDFEPAEQFDARSGLIDLNPPGRVQTNKRRPVIVATEGLQGWLPVWAAEDLKREAEQRGYVPNEPIPLLVYKRERVRSIKRGVLRIGDRIGIPEFTPYSIRRFMPTMVRRLCPLVPRERRSMWLGHAVAEGSRTTDHYEGFDPEALRDVALATDFVISELAKLCSTPLLAIESLLKPAELRRIGARPSKGKPMEINEKDGGRGRVRTCDPSRVNDCPDGEVVDFPRKQA